MFQGLSYITDHNGAVSDYHAEGVYHTFTFRNGRCFEHNEEVERRILRDKQHRAAVAQTQRRIFELNGV